VKRLAPVAAVLLLAGCGGGPDFAKSAASICGKANTSVRKLGPEPTILTERHARWILRQASIDLEAVAGLRSLKPPNAERSSFREMLGHFDDGLAQGKVIARADRRRNEAAFRAAVVTALNHITNGQLAAAALRLKGCDRLGAVAR
jgi:hypothetical protein